MSYATGIAVGLAVGGGAGGAAWLLLAAVLALAGMFAYHYIAHLLWWRRYQKRCREMREASPPPEGSVTRLTFGRHKLKWVQVAVNPYDN